MFRKRIIAFLLVISILFSFVVVSASAASSSLYDTDTVEQWNLWIENNFILEFPVIGNQVAFWRVVDSCFKVSGVDSLDSRAALQQRANNWNNHMNYSTECWPSLVAYMVMTASEKGPWAVIGYDSDLGVYRLYDQTTGIWLVDSAGRFPYYSESESTRQDIWLPFSTAVSKTQVSVLTKDSLSDLCLTLNQTDRTCSVRDTEIRDQAFYVIIDAYNNIYANADGCPYVAHYDKTVTDQKFDYIVNEGDTVDNSTVIDNSQVIDMSNGTFNYIDESGKQEFFIDELVYDMSTQSYSSDTYTITYDNDTYNTWNYTWNTVYNITNTYITNIGQTELYEPLELYYVLPDGRSSADLTAEEVAGISFEFADCVNYAKSATDTSLRALYHFDGNTDDSSYFSTQGSFDWISGASITYMDVGTFDGALYLGPEEHQFQITLPSNIGFGDFTVQFRYYQEGAADTQSNIENSLAIGGSTVLQWDESYLYSQSSTTACASLGIGSWSEIAVIRSSGTTYLCYNGLNIASFTDTMAYTDTITLTLGDTTRASSMIDELRVLNQSLFVLGSESDSILPTGYTQLEYIESNGTQYIDTGYYPNQNTRVVMDVQALTSGTNIGFMGARTSTSADMFVFWMISSSTVRSDFGSSKITLSDVSTLERFTIVKNKEITTFGTHSILNTASDFTAPCSLTLLTVNTAGVIGNCMSAKLYSCQIYDNGTLVRDFVPCINADGSVGLYDVVNGFFYVDAAGGSFVAGSEVTETVVVSTDYYTPTSVPYDTNAVLVLPDGAFPIADEYVDIQSSSTNLLAAYNLSDWLLLDSSYLLSNDVAFSSRSSTTTSYSPDSYLWNSSGTIYLYGYPYFYSNSNVVSFSSTGNGTSLFSKASTISPLYSSVCNRRVTTQSSSSYIWYDVCSSSSYAMSLPSVGVYSCVNAGGYSSSTMGLNTYLADGTYTLSIVNDKGEVASNTFTVSVDKSYYSSQSSAYANLSVDTVSAFGYQFGLATLPDTWYGEFFGDYAWFYVLNQYIIISPESSDPDSIVYVELVSGSSTDLTAEYVSCMYSSEEVQPNTAAIQTDIPINGYTVGGVRPTFPVRGDVWMPVSNNRITNVYVYNGSAWEEVNARWYTGSRWIPIYAFDITTLEDCWDIADIDTVVSVVGSEQEFWNWWKRAWTDFRSWLSDAGLGGSNVDPDDKLVSVPGAEDDPETEEDESEDGYSFLDLAGSLVEGVWSVVRGIVKTATGGITGIFDAVIRVDDFSTSFDENGTIMQMFTYRGDGLWD